MVNPKEAEEEKERRLKQAFSKIKENIEMLKGEISEIRQFFKQKNSIFSTDSSTHLSTHTQTNPQQFDTKTSENEGNKPQILSSTGNDGVSTDRQTADRQTNSTFSTYNQQNHQQNHFNQGNFSSRQIKDIVETLTQNLKKKFSSLTSQEFYIFSLIYNLDIEGQKPDYKSIAIKAGLTESSVRDYISRLIHKGIPIKKEKINNKMVLISVPDELKNLATLDSLAKLRQQFNSHNQFNNQII